MSLSRVFLFMGNNVVIPESMTDEEVPDGLNRDTVDQAFGRLEYYKIPPIGLNKGPVGGFLFKDDLALPPCWRSIPVRQAILVLAGTEMLPGSDAGNSSGSKQGSSTEHFLRSYHVLQWLNESVYCGSCGEKNGDSPDELARLCPCCGRIEYPRITPAVIVLVTDDSGRALLAHNSKFRKNLYSLIAGFAEAGESLELASRREIREEVNIEISDLRYITSQSWPFPNSLMTGFSARYAGGKLKSDGKEITEARWFTREDLIQAVLGNTGGPEIPAPGSVSRYIIDKWLKGEIE
jgi:NAD+ diphosphatase